jgi:uncharacterized protein YwbE
MKIYSPLRLSQIKLKNMSKIIFLFDKRFLSLSRIVLKTIFKYNSSHPSGIPLKLRNKIKMIFNKSKIFTFNKLKNVVLLKK